MAPDRWQQLNDLFHRARDFAPDARATFLATACGGDEALREQVERLLRANDEASGFMGQAAADVASMPASAPVESEQIGAYRVVREIGHGGMGTVYLAERADAQFEMRVAIKVIRPGMDTEAVLERFRHERRILAGLEHPNIARLLDGGTTGRGLSYFVMEYVEGQPIDEYCRARQLTIEQRLGLFQQVCAAVSYAHQHLVVHRDIKPSNILVTAGGTPKLLDFGIAKLLDDDDGTVATRADGRVMTPQYASPEQVRGERITTVSDVYALGVLLYELLAGERPYDVTGKPPADVQRIIASDEPAKPSVAAARSGNALAARRLRGDLDTIAMTAMRKEPGARYASVAFLADDVARHLSEQPVVARGESWTYRAAKFVRRQRLAVGAAAAILLTLIGGVIATSYQARVAREERRVADLERARAERRFADVRRLANSFLFEFHDAIAALPGSTPARLLVVTKALEYLDSLAKEAAGNRELQEELATAYDRVGDVQGNPGGANLGDAAGALASYRKAQAIRQALAAGAPDPLRARVELAISTMRIGIAYFARGAVKDAVGQFREVLAVREEAVKAGVPSAREAQVALAEVTGRLCTTLVAVGDLAGAIDNCRRSRSVTETLLASTPDDYAMLATRAVNGAALGNALRLNRQLPEAAVSLEAAIGEQRDLLTRKPLDADVRRRLAVSHAYLANVQLEQKQADQAAHQYELAIEELGALAAADPANARTRTELSYMLNQRVQILMASGRKPEAVTDVRRALALLRAGTEQAGAGGEAFNEYAWALVSSEVEEVRDPAAALKYATRAIELAGSPNAVYLHTLAWAHYRLGQTADAVRALEQALGTLAPATGGPAVGLRRRIEADLAVFKSGGVK